MKRISYLIIFLIFSLLTWIEAQRWAGTYAWDDQCPTRYCCCYGGTMTLVHSGSDLILSSDTRGCSTSRVTARYPYPNGYSFSREGLRGSSITYTMSSDSNTLTARNNGDNRCSGTARRTSATNSIKSTVNFASILFCCCVQFLFLPMK